MSGKKIVNICLIIAALFLYYLASQIIELAFDGLNIPITRDFWFTLPNTIAAVIAAVAYIAVSKNSVCMEFLTESVAELSKVTYPTKKESGQSAVVVIVMVSIATIFLAFFDSVWSYLTRLILTS